MEQVRRDTELYEISGPFRHIRPGLPPAPSVARPALVNRIEEGMAGRLVLLTAPAGWGKSSVLAEWARTTSLTVAWVRCDTVANDAGRFVRSVVSSLESVCPGFGGDIFAMLRSPRPLPAAQLLSVLTDAVFEHAGHVALVLDDFHFIDDGELLEGVYHLVSNGPENLHVVIAGRSAPAWPMARWRAHGDVLEVGTRELAFTREEVLSLLGDELSASDIVDVLHQRSEGWAAALRLGQLWLRQHDDRAVTEPSFVGSHRDIADYLAEEVIRQQSPETERFLMMTSVVDRFSASLAAELTGLAHAASILDQIERQELFIVPLDHDRQWYRYHDLFRQFLQSRLERELSGIEPDLNRRAAMWFEQNGMLLDGATSYLRAGEVEAAANLVSAAAATLLLRDGETVALIRMVEQLPRDAVDRLPELQVYFAWALVLVGRLDEAEALAKELEQRIETEPKSQEDALRVQVASVRSRIAAYRGDHDATIAYASEALECAGLAMDWLRADCLLSLGFAYRAKGDIDTACDMFGQATTLGWSTGFAHAALWGSRYQALTFVSRGLLRDAEALIESNMDRARQSQLSDGPARAALLVGRGELRYERNDLEGARRDLTDALTLAREVADAKILMNVLVALAKLEYAEGNVIQARDSARRAVSIFDGTGEKATEAWLALRHGDLSEVRRWMDTYIAQVGEQPSLEKGEAEQAMLGRAMLALGDHERAEAFLTRLLAEAEATARFGTALTIRILLARIADEGGAAETALDHARAVIDLGMRERYVRSILDEGAPFLRLLRRAMRQESSTERRQYASMLLAAAERSTVIGAPLGQAALAESLTPRQEEVLRLMVEGRSNREIAESLYVAEGTIKAHVNQIFGKLMVRNRAEAIRAARLLGLVV